ncbi:molybdopterin converting factor subunit 1 [Undibacterium flavidum]|uniref:Molybdopterin converting factor subunit 1 n=1 Tax=Undibacterium flavidum TaxID=2762297 RepID=A0ABR6YE08_9BURK|nr:molybdopterin converting factor subunit 1 [Undibacterium flavidum]MBC3874800.1 molybdopterin converting factor subunit 1 [Undibacterium flavidum]
MKIQLKFFASVREKLGSSGELLELDGSVKTAQQVRQLLMTRGDMWAEVLAPSRALRMAYNQQMVNGEVQLQDGGELAFFPPVTGG